MGFSITKNGKKLKRWHYSWNKKTRTLSTKEEGLFLDFSDMGMENVKFITGSFCTFKTRSDCTFRTSHSCTFDTGSQCVFYTANNCTFDTGSHCTFETGSGCMFRASHSCKFDVGEASTLIRRNVMDAIILPSDITIKTNRPDVRDYNIIRYKTDLIKKMENR